MAYQKLQAGEALAVIPSDTIDIPNPAAIANTGTAAAPTGAQLVGTGTEFTKTVAVGDIVYDTTNSVVATVDAIVSDTVLTTSAAIATGASYVIYSQANNPSNGCVLYVGVAGDVKVKMAGGNEVLFKGALAGTFLPINVTRVLSTGTAATDIVALW
jgi:hypothetical protein|tara:strand:- start:400 stop:870 length:471 start_codon:yes stop_codon:yes gene_type:complete